MLVLANTGRAKVELLERDLPEPGPSEVRVRTAVCGICRTDIELIFELDRLPRPWIPGHEWSGTIDAVGAGIDKSWLKRRCVAENALSDGQEVGFSRPGAYGQYFITEARNVHLLPDDFSFSTAALIEPLAVCVRAFRRLRIENKSAALICGDGPIGLLMLMLLKRHGVEHVSILGGVQKRLALAKELGASTIIDRTKPGGENAIQRLYPNVIDATGVIGGITTAFTQLDRGGKLLILGDYGTARADFPWLDIVHRELELIGSVASAGAWPEAVKLATTHAVPIKRLITHELNFADYAQGFALAQDREHAIKVLLRWT